MALTVTVGAGRGLRASNEVGITTHLKALSCALPSQCPQVKPSLGFLTSNVMPTCFCTFPRNVCQFGRVNPAPGCVRQGCQEASGTPRNSCSGFGSSKPLTGPPCLGGLALHPPAWTLTSVCVCELSSPQEPQVACSCPDGLGVSKT